MASMYLWHNWIVRTGIGILIGFISLEMSAQEGIIRPDLRDTTALMGTSMPLKQPVPVSYKDMLLTDEQLIKRLVAPPENLNHSIDFSFKKPPRLPYYTNPSPLLKGDYSTSGLIPFGSGAFYGSGRQTTMPGLGGMNEASLGYIYQFNPHWSVQMGVDALKIYLPPFSVGQTFGVSGRMTYRASDRLAFNAFGSYYQGPSFSLRSHSYGATMKVGVTDRFYMEMGAERHYNPLTGNWEIVPIVIPSYKFNKMELGLDVGGILYQILHNVVINKDQMNKGNPTIAPPRPFQMHR